MALDLCLNWEVQERIVSQSWLWLDVFVASARAIRFSEGILVGSRLSAALPSTKMRNFVGRERAVYHTVLIEVAWLFDLPAECAEIQSTITFVALALPISSFPPIITVTVSIFLSWFLHHLIFLFLIAILANLSLLFVLLYVYNFSSLVFVILVKSS